jgi:hypothetical protein
MLTLHRYTLIEAMIMWIKKPLLQCLWIRMIERENHGMRQTCRPTPLRGQTAA